MVKEDIMLALVRRRYTPAQLPPPVAPPVRAVTANPNETSERVAASRARLPSECSSHRESPEFLTKEARWFVLSAPEEIEENEATLPDPNRVRHPWVSHLLLQALYIDKTADQAYKPAPTTTIVQALQHLNRNGCVGVQGGLVFWYASHGIFTVKVLDSGKEAIRLNYQEVSDLLRASYPQEPLLGAPHAPIQPKASRSGTRPRNT
jgi:hypothetical protein